MAFFRKKSSAAAPAPAAATADAAAPTAKQRRDSAIVEESIDAAERRKNWRDTEQRSIQMAEEASAPKSPAKAPNPKLQRTKSVEIMQKVYHFEQEAERAAGNSIASPQKQTSGKSGSTASPVKQTSSSGGASRPVVRKPPLLERMESDFVDTNARRNPADKASKTACENCGVATAGNRFCGACGSPRPSPRTAGSAAAAATATSSLDTAPADPSPSNDDNKDTADASSAAVADNPDNSGDDNHDNTNDNNANENNNDENDNIDKNDNNDDDHAGSEPDVVVVPAIPGKPDVPAPVCAVISDDCVAAVSDGGNTGKNNANSSDNDKFNDNDNNTDVAANADKADADGGAARGAATTAVAATEVGAPPSSLPVSSAAKESPEQSPRQGNNNNNNEDSSNNGSGGGDGNDTAPAAAAATPTTGSSAAADGGDEQQRDDEPAITDTTTATATTSAAAAAPAAAATPAAVAAAAAPAAAATPAAVAAASVDEVEDLPPCPYPIGARLEIHVFGPGRLAFYGFVDGKDGLWFGIVLEEENGRNDGSVNGKRYFDATGKFGIFVRREHIVEWLDSDNNQRNNDDGNDNGNRHNDSDLDDDENLVAGTLVDSENSSAASTPRDSTFEQGSRVGMRVMIKGHGRGTVAFEGKVEGKVGQWFGVRMDEATGKNNGVYNGVRYFSAPEKSGLFIRPNDPTLKPLDELRLPLPKDKQTLFVALRSVNGNEDNRELSFPAGKKIKVVEMTETGRLWGKTRGGVDSPVKYGWFKRTDVEEYTNNKRTARLSQAAQKQTPPVDVEEAKPLHKHSSKRDAMKKQRSKKNVSSSGSKPLKKSNTTTTTTTGDDGDRGTHRSSSSHSRPSSRSAKTGKKNSSSASGATAADAAAAGVDIAADSERPRSSSSGHRKSRKKTSSAMQKPMNKQMSVV